MRKPATGSRGLPTTSSPCGTRDAQCWKQISPRRYRDMFDDIERVGGVKRPRDRSRKHGRGSCTRTFHRSSMRSLTSRTKTGSKSTAQTEPTSCQNNARSKGIATADLKAPCFFHSTFLKRICSGRGRREAGAVVVPDLIRNESQRRQALLFPQCDLNLILRLACFFGFHVSNDF